MRYLLLLVLFGVGNLYCQDTTKQMWYHLDVFKEKKTLRCNHIEFFKDDSNKGEGLTIVTILYERDTGITINRIVTEIKDDNIKGSLKGDGLIIVFEEGGRIELVNYWDDSKRGRSIFKLDKSHINELRNKTIKGIRYESKMELPIDKNHLDIVKTIKKSNSGYFRDIIRDMDRVNKGELVIKVYEGGK